MIQQFVTAFENRKNWIRDQIAKGEGLSYQSILTIVVQAILDESDDDWYSPSPKNIASVDFGDYQGTTVFVIGQNSYQPTLHWYVLVGYGSCSHCDRLQDIDKTWDKTEEERLDQLVDLARSITQEIRPMWPGDVEV